MVLYMAGDWIKLQKDTPDKPEVLAMAARLNLDPDAVVGKLVRIWSWFDTHTVDGHASCVTFALLDRLTGVTGFAEQLALVGWLHQSGHGLMLPNFDYHNGETSKKRALASNRQQKKRETSRTSHANSHASSVTKALPEKRREEKSNKPPISPAGGLFDRFWTSYPRKVGEDAARKAFDRRKPTDELVNEMVAAIGRQTQSEQWRQEGGRFIPHPATWLTQGRWMDGPQESIPTPLDRGPDPELERIKRDAAQATPMPSFIKDLAAQLTGKAH